MAGLDPAIQALWQTESKDGDSPIKSGDVDAGRGFSNDL